MADRLQIGDRVVYTNSDRLGLELVVIAITDNDRMVKVSPSNAGWFNPWQVWPLPPFWTAISSVERYRSKETT